MRALEARFWKTERGFCGLCVCVIAGHFGAFEKVNSRKGLSLRLKSECLGGRHDLAWVAIF